MYPCLNLNTAWANVSAVKTSPCCHLAPCSHRWLPYTLNGSDVTWASWLLKSLATKMFFQQLVQAYGKENVEGHYWPFVRGIHQSLVDSPHKGPVIQKALPRASQNPIRPIRRTRAADFGPSLSMFKKAADIEVSYKTMYVCMAAENFFVTSWRFHVISSSWWASNVERILKGFRHHVIIPTSRQVVWTSYMGQPNISCLSPILWQQTPLDLSTPPTFSPQEVYSSWGEPPLKSSGLLLAKLGFTSSVNSLQPGDAYMH